MKITETDRDERGHDQFEVESDSGSTHTASNELLAKHRLKAIRREDDYWEVDSESGSTYEVRSVTCIDREVGSMYFQWRCSCPARRRCRHIDAVEQLNWDEAVAADDYDGMDVLERYEV